MIRSPTARSVPRSVPQLGNITPLAVPFSGMNARSAFATMGPEFAISLVNVICETYGLRTRKGYQEFANGLDNEGMVGTMMSYYPASAVPAPVIALATSKKGPIGGKRLTSRLIVAPFTPPPLQGYLFAARGDNIFDVTAGGSGPFSPEAGVSGTGSRWTHINFQNTAGAFLLACNDNGGYAIYDGASWTMPTMGVGAGQIDGVDPADLCFIMEWKKRIWFIEKNSTRAWYLPVEEITGVATAFDFGSLLPHGGQLSNLANWTVDGGAGIDDQLVAVGSQGDVAIYQGTDPDDPTLFNQKGVWYVGPLPAGRRQVSQSGGDVYILSQFGVIPVSKLLAVSNLSQVTMASLSYNIDPLIARLMQEHARYDGWQIVDAAKEELILIGVPSEATVPYGGDFFSYKRTTQSWTILDGTTYTSMVSVGANIMAGTSDGRVVYAFQGVLDNVQIGSTSGNPIVCQVTPAYQSMGKGGTQKRFLLVRPTYLCSLTPELVLQVLTDYGVPRPILVPTLPGITPSLWDEALWDIGTWGGMRSPIREWLGAEGVGFAATVQLDYACGGDTLLTSIDFWTENSPGVL